MNFKKTALLLAMAGVTAVPMAAQADMYASARIGLVNTDTDGGLNDMQIQSMASRFGIKSETDLGNGMTGFGQYEWDVDFDNGKSFDFDGDGEDDASTDASIKMRKRLVGLKGDFGSVTLGQTYHTFYNFVVGPNDNPWWGSGYAMVAYVGRTDNAITYAGGAGDISFGATAYVVGGDADEDAIDGTEFGASFGIGDMTLGLGIKDSEAQDDAIIGLALTGIGLGSANLGLGLQTQDEDTSFLFDVGIGNAYVHYEQIDLDAADATPSMLTLGYTQSLGRNTTAWYEFQNNDGDDAGTDSTVIRAILKYDIE